MELLLLLRSVAPFRRFPAHEPFAAVPVGFALLPPEQAREARLILLIRPLARQATATILVFRALLRDSFLALGLKSAPELALKPNNG